MLFRTCILLKRSYSQIKIAKVDRYNMNKAYFRRVDGDRQVDISFVYINEDKKINRQFNFTRKTSENIGALSARISTNLEKALNKKKKKPKKSNEETAPDNNQELTIEMYGDGIAIASDTIVIDLLNKKADLTMKIIDQMYNVIINAPWVVKLTMPTSILAGFTIYPLSFEALFTDKEYTEFTWYHGTSQKVNGGTIADIHIAWTESGKGYTYTPKPEEVGNKLKLKCLPANAKMSGPSIEVVSSVCVEAGPGPCPFETRHMFTQNKLSGKSFRVVSYNILADLYCDSDYTRSELHPYCPPYALDINYRKQLFTRELLGFNADIMCLQEVDCKIFDYDLIPVFESYSYKGVFTKKAKLVAEGMACFYRKDRFRNIDMFSSTRNEFGKQVREILNKETPNRLIETKSLVFAEELSKAPYFAHIWNAIKDNDLLVKRILDRSTAAQLTILQSIENSREILLVGNTHLYFHPDADHIRLTQGGLLINWVEHVIKGLEVKFPDCRISCIQCGDFNSVPSCGIYRLFTTGLAESDLEDWKSNAAETITGLTLKQSIPLASACGTPEYTNFTAGFADCLDYIFYNKEHLTVEQVVPLPSVDELQEHVALPSVVFPSDHISLVADLSFL